MDITERQRSPYSEDCHLNQAISELIFAALSKRIFERNHSDEIAFHLLIRANQTHVHKKNVCKKTRFETEAKSNSEKTVFAGKTGDRWQLSKTTSDQINIMVSFSVNYDLTDRQLGAVTGGGLMWHLYEQGGGPGL